MAESVTTHETQLYVKALANALLRFRIESNKVTRNWYAQTASEVNLERIGRDRNVPRLPGETDVAAYRERVSGLCVDANDVLLLDLPCTDGRIIGGAFEANQGIGSAEDIVRIIESFGLIHKGFFSGFSPGDVPEAFNLLVQTIGSQIYDGTFLYDSSKFYDGVGPNEITIEVNKILTDPEQAEIKKALRPILRASMSDPKILP